MKPSERGLAMIEAAGALVVLLPVIIAFVAVSDLISRRGYVQALSLQALSNFPVKPYSLDTGEVSYYLKPRFSTPGDSRPLDSDFERGVSNYLDELERRLVRDQFCNGQACWPAPFAPHYVIELLLISVPINTADGIVAGDGQRWSRTRAEHRSSAVYKRGSFIPQWQEGDIVRLGLRHQILSRAIEIVDASILNARPFPFALPTALRGSTTQQYYGAWTFGAGPSEAFDFGRNYLRGAHLVGVGVALNLESNPKAQLVRRVFGAERFVSSVEVGGPRNAL